ncbi:hypothetical protein IG195_21215 (plasmid) [Arthrobacter sp. TES]|uniref:hypothetical protein n=1 Tax=Paenarthrobacter sp. AT5 TaxID=2973089 RepID=UPI00041DB12D|nr:hypothetical protein [Paenarthrobacter sp. AT5]QOI65875.1 hypothetical protein IG195_21215 [Arthrobacter sp. TES]WOC63374.1 hypothetical protein RI444_22105 [Paenarthrobacter sp. AT5]
MRKHWKALTAVGVVVLIVAVAVILINRPAPATEQDPGSLQASGKFGFPVSDLSIGEGGTTKASDGKTITGYNGTCDSAAQAAANYTHLIKDLNLGTWEQQKKVLTEVSKPGPWFEEVTSAGDLLADAESLPAGAFDGGWYTRSDVAAGGLYRVAGCEEEQGAVVQVFTGGVGARVNEAPNAFFQTITFELAWDGDWKITDAAIVPVNQDFDGRVKDGGPMSVGTNMDGETAPVLRNDLVSAFFKDKSRDGWIEYANAQR